MTRILVTNDDGIEAPGLAALARALDDAGHDVLVVAPTTERSGWSAAVGTVVPGEGVRLVRVHDQPALDGIEAWSVDAPPAFCVLLALRLNLFDDPPDLVVAGINPGFNTGSSVLHSGTVGAALTAGNAGARALAVSIGMPTEPPEDQVGHSGAEVAGILMHWASAATLAVAAVAWLEQAEPATILNLNVPNRPLADVAGVTVAPLAHLGAAITSVANVQPDGTLDLRLSPPRVVAAAGTDTALVGQGWCTITSLVPPHQGPPIPGLDRALVRVIESGDG